MSDETKPFDPFDHHSPTQVQLENIESFRSAAKAFRTLLEERPPSRERALALTHLEEALMWANKAAFR